MLYFLASYSTELGFLKSIYLRDFISFSLSFLLVLFLGKPFIHYLQKTLGKHAPVVRLEYFLDIGARPHMSISTLEKN